ncbi:AraC family transcriptional regulator [Chryseobacterium piperi]|uniref:AraC family transcriptional regulator n=1 Tax=Chryseobacterium piperi TaxID=558152 RepID=A0A086A1X3_9FLAO|nr:helix-turn-helix transcriptional regulator [Chryseobacterium piperi]ASW73487.1 AraC family transcriptional regulator [Chryseobacterium piperi]KFF10687.1 AraC family transcriptional regulator [Chryseobacterium piperi]
MKVPERVTSITALHNLLKLKRPLNPLISVFDFNEVSISSDAILSSVTTDFYVIAIKKDCAGRCKYGQQYYDFEEGIMYFIAPDQVVQFEDILLSEVRGSVLVVHPDFFQGYPIASSIRDYGYFSYSANEALHLSEREEKSITDIVDNIRKETENNMDVFTQDLLVSNIDLLLKYCDRFYNRQFLTRKKVNNDLLTRLENLLDDYFKNDNLRLNGIPSVQFLAGELNITPNYLSDMLRVHTGKTTQQHIQKRLIDKAKELLSTTSMSVSEIAYHLGFEHPQSFHRLFKNRTSISPIRVQTEF